MLPGPSCLSSGTDRTPTSSPPGCWRVLDDGTPLWPRSPIDTRILGRAAHFADRITAINTAPASKVAALACSFARLARAARAGGTRPAPSEAEETSPRSREQPSQHAPSRCPTAGRFHQRVKPTSLHDRPPFVSLRFHLSDDGMTPLQRWLFQCQRLMRDNGR
jgi:hypothetical protein